MENDRVITMLDNKTIKSVKYMKYQTPEYREEVKKYEQYWANLFINELG